MEIEAIDSPARLREIRPHWDELLAQCRADDFFISPGWFFAWWQVFSRGQALRFVALWDNGSLQALFPLYRSVRGPFRVVMFTGHPRLADRMDFLLRPGRERECLALFADHLFDRKDWDVLSLRGFGAFTDTPALLSEVLARKRRRHLVTPDEPYYYIDTTEFADFEAYLRDSVAASRRKNIRNLANRLRKLGGEEWGVQNTIDEAMLDAMEELDTTRTARSAHRASFFFMPGNKDFVRALVKEAPENILLMTLRIHGRLASHQLLFVYRNKLFSYQPAFDISYARLGIGTLMLVKAIEYAFQEKMAEFDFLKGPEQYKTHYTETCRESKRLIAYRGGWRSLLLYLYHTGFKPLRRALGRSSLVRKFVSPDLRRKYDI